MQIQIHTFFHPLFEVVPLPSESSVSAMDGSRAIWRNRKDLRKVKSASIVYGFVAGAGSNAIHDVRSGLNSSAVSQQVSALSVFHLWERASIAMTGIGTASFTATGEAVFPGSATLEAVVLANSFADPVFLSRRVAVALGFVFNFGICRYFFYICDHPLLIRPFCVSP